MGYALSEATKVRLAKKTWLNVFFFVVLANLPDIDFLPGFLLGQPNRYHHHFVHSLSFALFAGLAGGLIFWRRYRKGAETNHTNEEAGSYRFWPYFLTISGIVFSHCVLDLFTEDFSPPYGMLLFWPVDASYYDVSWDIFAAVHKSNDSATFIASLFNWHNFKVILREFLILALIIGLLKMIRQLRWFFGRQRAADLEKTQVARKGLSPEKGFPPKLGLLEVSTPPPRLSRQRSLAPVSPKAEEDEPRE
jgi:hypothetical protein